MATINIAPYEPLAGDTSDAGEISNAFVAIQSAVNALDNSNVSNSAAIAVSKLALPGGTTTWLRADGQFTAPTTTAAVYQKTTEKDIANDNTKKDLLNAEITIAANALGANGGIEFYAGGDYLNNTGATKTITLEWKLGAQVMWDSAASSTIAASANRRAWYFHAVIKALGTTANQRSAGSFWLSDVAAATTGTGTVSSQTSLGLGASFLGVATTVAMTSNQTLTLSSTHSAASAALSIRLEHAWVKVIN